MPVLQDILYKIRLLAVSGPTDIAVVDIAFDSRQVSPGSMFVAIRGTQSDGHAFIAQAIEKGAAVIMAETLPTQQAEGVTWLQVADTAAALGIAAANFWGNPSEKLKIVAVTGTNGKTTTATLLYKLFRALGYSSGLLSTVRNLINDKEITATHTTPDALQLQRLLAKMVAEGCTHCFMEASSHAIVQHRLAGMKLTGAIFSNITHDHLDYHLTFEAYIAAKKGLFDMLPKEAWALTNLDDKRGMVMLQNTKASKYTYALKKPADYKARLISNTLQGLELDVDGKIVWFKLIGDFNAYNLLSVYGAAMLLGEEQDEVLMQLSNISTAPGRFEQVAQGSDVVAVVDYAHTPDALENVLQTIANFRTGSEKVITVVGCGGNRDKAKRPLMAEIAASLSDRVILTSDNPRNEEPAQIIADMQAGLSASNTRKVISILDRREAIRTACMMAEPGDIILVAGKGHETYQEIAGVKHPFDDREVLAQFVQELRP
ncbi:UDP-N-acetylmuramoyl-L-alanyl-D-glutamate--2,6-diaminopimelate ligase [Cesiribacter andamanensis]|uniref:UDP-N-acetylmuramoyl-L-alanyl-D-glutamate--2,6-diaminopimelate ligase n=1 Tax=Cesiribacter andamanensis AMV16 TaxID=1279009 RepID=M7NP89_9BACT|nr:UDP-N-acetylmuramoyl-L-alanyl-D-glutamate--2,6-diaminopimelate ligase [Cesiribacter andamanensis]EMR03540.1 UDP-N-acetylmuramoyl-L-alanyl-D-glutamate--LD-lysine ligase [Cesiribacter andamanensis AMV16]